MKTLSEVVTSELLMMLARNLDHAPTADELKYTIDVMLQDLSTKGLSDIDAERVMISFKNMGPEITRFPMSKTVMDYLPRRDKAKVLEYTISDEKRRENLEKISDIARKLRKGMKV